MRVARRVGEVSHLPDQAFGPAAITWWGMFGLMLIEGITLTLVAASYLYVRQNYYAWPPDRTPLPSTLLPTINLVLMLVSVVPARLVERAAHRHDAGAIRIGLAIQGALGVIIMVLRYWECQALNVRWDTNAYGSVAWGVLVAHAVVAVTDVMDTIGLFALFAFAEPEEKHFVDATENSIFWYFIVGSWVPLYILVFLFPRWG